jgi:hypothetical protein
MMETVMARAAVHGASQRAMKAWVRKLNFLRLRLSMLDCRMTRSFPRGIRSRHDHRESLAEVARWEIARSLSTYGAVVTRVRSQLKPWARESRWMRHCARLSA